jgi:REP element-mobilizing transposase RayT
MLSLARGASSGVKFTGLSAPAGLALKTHLVMNPIFPLAIQSRSDYFREIATLCPPKMANTYTQINIHLVFSVKYRMPLIEEHFREELEKYITGIVQNRNHKMLAIYCMPDHFHALIGKRPNQSEADLVREIKSNSSKFINDKKWTNGPFRWQGGYGAFSHSPSQVPQVINYILNQPQHHAKQSFTDEYVGLLDRFGIEYKEEYVFD